MATALAQTSARVLPGLKQKKLFFNTFLSLSLLLFDTQTVIVFFVMSRSLPRPLNARTAVQLKLDSQYVTSTSVSVAGRGSFG